MATINDISSTSTPNIERELICFICTEVLYQPLTLLDCLHTFCGSCLKGWFSHQHRNASSHSSSSSSNPYTCPTCRATVKGARHNATVYMFLEMLLAANPGKARSEEEKEELAQIYKPGDNIMPKVEARRRERRSRRDEEALEARERRLVEQAQERSLRDVHGDSTSSSNALQPPTSYQDRSSTSRDREERRERRRQQAAQGPRQRTQTGETTVPRSSNMDLERERRESVSTSPPASSPRHPQAVEARQRQQTVVHQPSLTSLISSSENSSGSGNSDDLSAAQIRQEIERLGLLEGIDIDALSESEQDALVERVVEALRRHHEISQQTPIQPETNVAPLSTDNNPSPDRLQVNESRQQPRSNSSSRQRRTETAPVRSRDNSSSRDPRPTRTYPGDSSYSLPPSSSVVITHRRRASSQGQRSHNTQGSPSQSSPAMVATDSRTRTSANLSNRSQSQDRGVASSALSSHAIRPRNADSRGSSRGSEIQAQQNSNLSRSDETRQTSIAESQQSNRVAQSPTSLGSTLPEVVVTDPRATDLDTQAVSRSSMYPQRRSSGLHDEPSVSCFRCHRADIQYDVHRHCNKCEVNLCMWCYRNGKGCKHWYGFGNVAMGQFESLHPTSFDSMELPHMLAIGRQYKRPEQFAIIRSKLAKDGKTIIALQTTSNPADRLQEGRFCDRCNKFADSCVWSCDYCNWGEWGFCRECVNTHHCCTHPLLPSAHKSYKPISPTSKVTTDNVNPTSSELLATNLRPSPGVSQPSSATSEVSHRAGPLHNYITLTITTHCDICSQPIAPSSLRFHCPSHPSTTPDNSEAQGDYDICMTCYQNLVKTNRIKRDDGSAGWRKCPSGHRMIITTFEPDDDGDLRRRVVNDLVGGWKSPEEAMKDWTTEQRVRREGNGDSPSSPYFDSPDNSSTRRVARTRTGSYGADPASPAGASPFSSSSRFPPDGGTGLRGVTRMWYFPVDTERDPQDLVFPGGAEIKEIRIDERFPDWYGGVYAGDRGLLPASHVMIIP